MKRGESIASQSFLILPENHYRLVGEQGKHMGWTVVKWWLRTGQQTLTRRSSVCHLSLQSPVQLCFDDGWIQHWGKYRWDDYRYASQVSDALCCFSIFPVLCCSKGWYSDRHLCGSSGWPCVFTGCHGVVLLHPMLRVQPQLHPSESHLLPLRLSSGFCPGNQQNRPWGKSFYISPACIVLTYANEAVHLQIICKVIAIILHFFYLCVFAWIFVEALHLYRMLTEIRNINTGNMKFYYLLGYGECVWPCPLFLLYSSIICSLDCSHPWHYCQLGSRSSGGGLRQ